MNYYPEMAENIQRIKKLLESKNIKAFDFGKNFQKDTYMLINSELFGNFSFFVYTVAHDVLELQEHLENVLDDDDYNIYIVANDRELVINYFHH